MSINKRAGLVAQQKDLVNIPRLISHYYRINPDVVYSEQKVSFGTSGHRGTSLLASFNQHHIWAIVQAVVDYRYLNGITGPIFLGMDTHALSHPAFISAMEVLVANQVNVIAQKDESYTPTPVVSHAILSANKQFEAENSKLCADGLIITPSHNPPQDGGIKYNPPHGGPAGSDITSWIEQRANDYLKSNLDGIKITEYASALSTQYVEWRDLINPYVEDLENVIDMKAIADKKVRIGVDPLGGSGIYYWEPIAKKYDLDIALVNDKVDPAFGFMTLDKDGKIRMDCSSPFSMKGLLSHQENFDICIGNDPDFDRHGIVCPSFGLMNPNHYLAVAIDYLLNHRIKWAKSLSIGKTLVSSAMIDRICKHNQSHLLEVPVGFKWFVEGLSNSTIAFGGEESAGAAFLRHDGTTWCTDKDGFILGLLAAEIYAITGKTPAQRYQELEQQFGQSFYQRVDSPIDLEKKAKFATLSTEKFSADELAGEQIIDVLTHASGNGAAIGGIKIITENAWFAARPSGTEALFKLYAESFISESHLQQVISEANQMIEVALLNG
ncbi:alpha-D-glucose phosphate-specific phosphoglucomutase [Parashewanella spongiae]|uniref:Phosphoglucomutase n=1 Tax=Parashewanella spongiae TaxID=342950 RepID=A0A3A6TZP9_9GAMM|nr:phosphoglucomutase (alpha-D-glucose-1,6-bisphosphate-dependent) [Parashewanella spongiae]MCL1077503.1 phosphoglucomutase (alpha-D-glucose-1,6-bisphosphate-dependent) [Parashewanella spongiae]RJY18640.1 alpha-D-glucose phosphate-specific phosphoglucomutase [Parashewanella spongiae]